MCWFIDLTLYDTDKIKAEAISKKIKLKNGLYTVAFSDKNSIKRKQSKLALLDDTGHCACEIIVGDLESDGPKYMIDTSYVNRFIATLEVIHNEVDSGFDIEVIWGEDISDVEKSISYQELMELIRNELIIANARYKVV
jgi:hypothetical protein